MLGMTHTASFYVWAPMRHKTVYIMTRRLAIVARSAKPPRVNELCVYVCMTVLGRFLLRVLV